jgi:hypothetical protein
MKKRDVFQYSVGSAAYVEAHSRWRSSRGKKKRPSCVYCGERNPRLALKKAKEAMGGYGWKFNAVKNMKKGVQRILSVNPNLSKVIANSMISLLKIRNIEDYMWQSISISKAMEKAIEFVIRREPEQMDEIVVELLGLVNISATFDKLSDEGVEELMKFFESLHVKPVNTLETFMSQALELEARNAKDPNEFSGSRDKVTIATLASLAGRHKEDFALYPWTPVGTHKINELVEKYYGD